MRTKRPLIHSRNKAEHAIHAPEFIIVHLTSVGVCENFDPANAAVKEALKRSVKITRYSERIIPLPLSFSFSR